MRSLEWKMSCIQSAVDVVSREQFGRKLQLWDVGLQKRARTRAAHGE